MSGGSVSELLNYSKYVQHSIIVLVYCTSTSERASPSALAIPVSKRKVKLRDTNVSKFIMEVMSSYPFSAEDKKNLS